MSANVPRVSRELTVYQEGAVSPILQVGKLKHRVDM